jgi:hypothetical protein
VDIDKNGLVNWILKNGGSIHPLIVDSKLTNGTGLMNPSVFINDGKILVNIRHVNYTLYHAEHNIFNHHYGPLQYLHPEDDMTLRTQNFLAYLNDDLSVEKIHKVETSKLDVKPIWHFIGLEDARLFKWDKKMYLCGVRRDDNNTGSGRMELSEIEIREDSVVEVNRHKVPAPPPDSSYCEKNWMPILDMPYHFVKWTNPTEIVKFNLVDGSSMTSHLDETRKIHIPKDQRGGSQVIPWKGGHMAVTHEVDLYNDPLGRKDGKYRHRFILWDDEWNIIKFSREFSFMMAKIEFCAGAAVLGDDLLISFGYQDNSSYILKTPISLIESFIDS